MAYDYSGGRRDRRYIDDQLVFDDGDHAHYNTNSRISQDKQIYRDNFYDGYYQEDGPDYNLQVSGQHESHTTYNNQHRYKDDIRRDTVDYAVNAEGHRSRSELIGNRHSREYRDRTYRGDEQYHSHQNEYRNVPSAKYLEDGTRYHMGTDDTNGLEQRTREIDRSSEHWQERYSTHHGSFHSKHSSLHSQNHMHRRHGLKYEHRHGQEEPTSKRDQLYESQGQCFRTFDNEYDQDHLVIGQGREFEKLSQEENVEMGNRVYENGHGKKLPPRMDNYDGRVTETQAANIQQQFIKDEHLCDFSNYPKERQHTFPSKRIATSVDNVVLSDDSHQSVCTKQRKSLLGTPAIEPKNTCLLPTPVDSELLDTELHSVDTGHDYQKSQLLHQSTGLLQTPPDEHSTKLSKGLLPTPTANPEKAVHLTEVSRGILPTPNASQDKHVHSTKVSRGLLPTPTANPEKAVHLTEVSRGILPTPNASQDKHVHSTKVSRGLLPNPTASPEKTVHSTKVLRGILPIPNVSQDKEVHSTNVSRGLLPNPTASPEKAVHSTKVFRGLLPTPTVSPEVDEMFASPSLLPEPTCKPFENFNLDNNVQQINYPSKGLLPTPTTIYSPHPAMIKEEMDDSIHDNLTEERILDHDVDNSPDNMKVESDGSEVGKVIDKQLSDNEKRQNVKSANIQDRLTKTLEGMQKTMAILKEKITTEKILPPKDEPSIKKEVLNCTLVRESKMNVKGSSDIPINISSEDNPECAEKIDENLDEIEGEANIKTTSEIYEYDHGSTSSILSETKKEQEQSRNIIKESEDTVKENSIRKQNRHSMQPREYKTYREWRLAKERMNKYFQSQSSESESNDHRRQQDGVKGNHPRHYISNQPCNSSDSESIKGNHPRNSISNQPCNSSDSESIKGNHPNKSTSNQPCNSSDSEIVKEKIETKKQEENVLEKVRTKELDTKTGEGSMDDINNEKVIEEKADTVSSEQMKENEKSKNCRSRRNSSESLSSHHSKDISSYRNERSESRDCDSDRSHKHSRSSHREHSDKNKKSDREHHKKSHKHSHKHSSSSKESKHSSSSRESKHHYSSKEIKHSSSSKKKKHSSSSKESKHSSSFQEGKHSSSFKERRHSSSSKERRQSSSSKDSKHRRSSSSSKHKSSSKSEHRSNYKEDYNESKKSGNKYEEIKNENSCWEKSELNINVKSKKHILETDLEMTLLEKLAIENEKPPQNKHDTDRKGNLFENFEMENEIIDVVGGISSDEDDIEIKVNKLEPPEKELVTSFEENSKDQKLNNINGLKTAFVKLFDINKKIKGKDIKKNEKEIVKTRENIFDQLSDEMSSVHNIKVPSVLKAVKEDASTKFKKSSEIVKLKVLPSEDSSSDVDQVVKMNLFLNKDKRKTVQMNALKSSKLFQNFVVSDDSISESCSDVTPQYSAYRHDKKKNEFVKCLKRGDKTLYWKDLKLTLPKIKLRKLDDKDITRLKSKLKRKSKPGNMDIKQNENKDILQGDKSKEKLVSSKDTNSRDTVENKRNKTYKRIVPIKYSSTEQSESSDFERIISQKERRPIIVDSDDNLEGSLGSEDLSLCNISDIDISDEEGNKVLSEQNKISEGNKVDSEFDEDPKSTLVEDKLDSEFDEDLESTLVEDKLISKFDENPKSTLIEDKIDCEFDEDPKSTLVEDRLDSDFEMDHKSTLVEDKLNREFDNTPKSTLIKEKSPMVGFQIHDGTFVEIQDFQMIGLAKDDTVENNPVAQALEENEETESKTEKHVGSKISCSESAGKSYRRRSHSDSSSESSDDENSCQHRSSTKYQKLQSNKSDEKIDNQNNSNDNNDAMNKNTSPKGSVLGKQLPSHAKRLFKSSKQIKRTSSIMQMDGNADPIAGPPDESSGEEGDVEDNVINIDSDEECSSSQDLFEDLPERLVQMSQKPKHIGSASIVTSNSFKIKDENVENKFDIKDPYFNKEIISNSSATSDETQESGEENMKNDEDEEPVIKEEPDWLKCYTQEPDTIFLSDDDEMIMSVSQPVILVSDDETQDPEADDNQDVKVKQEKPDLDVYGANETTFEYTFEDYSSAEDWSDNGSDFEPENMFKSLEMQTKTKKASLISPERSMSDISLISVDDIVKSQALLDKTNSEQEQEGFESSDGAVLSVDEDELLRSPNVDENLVAINEDKVFNRVDNNCIRSENMKSNFKSSVTKDFGSSDDEILSKGAFYLENQYKNTLETKQEVIPSDDESNEKTEEASSNENFNPYLQETQVDPNLTDENTSNSFSIFDFHSEHFSDISDCDSKTVNCKSNKTSKERNDEHETLSDDSDFMIINPPNDKHEGNKRSDKIDLYGVQTQVDETDDHCVPNKDFCESKTDKNNDENLYLAQTQVEQPGPSSRSKDIPLKDTGSRQYLLQKSMPTAENELFEAETQVDGPEPRNASKKWLSDTSDVDTSSESFSGEDPQLQFYIPEKQRARNLKNKRLSHDLGIEFESFSDDDDNAYQVPTETISSPDSQASDDILANAVATPRKQQIEIALSDTSIDNDAYMKATQVASNNVSEDEKESIEDQDLYNMATQIDPTDLTNSPESNSSSAIIISETDEEDDDNELANKDAYLQATQAFIEDDSDEQINNEDIFNMATQNDGCDNSKSAENSDDSISILTMSKDDSNKEKKQVSMPDDDTEEYFTATLAYFDHDAEDDNEEAEEEDVYNMATQRDVSDIEIDDENRDEGFVTIPKRTKTSASEVEHDDSSVDEDVYLAATQAYVEDISEDTEDEDVFNAATQNDILSNQKMKSIKKRLNDCNDMAAKSETNKLSKSDHEKKQSNTDDDYIQATQAYMDDDNEEEEVDDIYNMATQVDDIDTGISALSKNDEKEFNEVTLLDSSNDDDVYLAATQVDVEDVSEIEDENDAFNVSTQKDIYDLSSDENDINDNNKLLLGAFKHKRINKSSKSDSRCKQFEINFDDKNDEAYHMDTQCDELPDIMQSSDVEEIDLLTCSSEDDARNSNNLNEQLDSSFNLNKQIDSISNKIDETDENSTSGTKSILKRPHAEITSGRNVKFDESSAAKKPRFILPERKTISIEPQHLKTSAEKRATGLSSTSKPGPQNTNASGPSTSFKPRQFFRPKNTGGKSAGIEIFDATKSDMWLSKKIPAKHFDKKGSKGVMVKKRKRKSDEGDSLQARMMAARSQLKERAMYSVTHQDVTKKVKTAPTANELEDVALPTGSQIIDQGLPLLFTTDLILKGTKSTPLSSDNVQASSETSSSTAVMSVVTTTLSTATTSAVTTCVQSTTAATRLHTTVSTSEKNLKYFNLTKDNNKHISPSQSKEDASKEKRASGEIQRGDPSVSKVGRGHDKKKSENTANQSKSTENQSRSTENQSRSHSKTDKHKHKRSEKSGSSKINVDKENVSKSKDDNKDSVSKEKRSTRERSRSGDSNKDRKVDDKHKKRGNDKHRHKSGEHKKDGDRKRDDKKYSGKERHDSGKRYEKATYSKSKHSANEKVSRSESSESRQVKSSLVENESPVASRPSEIFGRINLEATTACSGISIPISTSISSIASLNTNMSASTCTGSTTVTTGQTTLSVASIIAASRVKTAPKVVRFASSVISEPFVSRNTTASSVVNSVAVISDTFVSRTATIPTVVNSSSVVSGTSVSRSTSASIVVNSLSAVSGTSVSRSIITPSVVSSLTSVGSGTTVRPVSTVRPTISTHIQSSVLLQKQGSRPPAPSTSTNDGPPMVMPSRQPLQPLHPDNMYNMFNNVSNLRWDNFLTVILKWSPNWYEEREKMEQTDRRAPPPDVTNDLCGHGNHKLFPLIGKYLSFKEYSEKFMLPLLLHETWESCYSTWRERKGRRKLINHKMMFSHQSQGGDKLMVYTLIGLISDQDRGAGNCVNEGDLVKLTINGDMKIDNKNKRNLDYTMSGFIDKVIYRDFSVDRICAHYKEMGDIRKGLRNCISLKLNVRVRYRSFIPNDKVIIQLQSISTIMNTWRQFTGLASIPRSPLCRDLLYPTANMTYCDKAPASVPRVQDKYNESQSRAINTAGKIVMLPKEIPRICLLQGPPGTGKSHTIVGIIKHIVKVTQGRCRICLTAPSHAAVDELLRRLNKLNRNIEKNAQIKMVRLGKKSSVHEDIQSLCLDNLVQKNLLQAQKEELLKQLPKSLLEERKALEKKIIAVRKKMDTAKDQFQRQKHRSDLKKLEKQKEVLDSNFELPKTHIDRQQERRAQCNILQRAHVIAGTLSRIGGGELRSAFSNISGPAFDVVIVDEATQAIELETLIPLQYGVTKLILVGDPEQLPPTVLSQKATENHFNMSLFERLDGHFKGQNINPVILLDRQYRMDPEIAAFPNKYIYEGKITNDKCVETRSQIPLVPYLLFNVSEGRELFSQGTRSMSNPLEAIFTAELCKFTITNSTIIERVIGIIAPYANQKSQIVKELEKRHLKNIEVSTVDGFQGREKHVIIMSCVRANQCGTVGFVGDRKRMNVSLTRAKYAMYLVGHFESLQVSDEWKPLLADARQRQKIINVDQYSMEVAIKKVLRK